MESIQLKAKVRKSVGNSPSRVLRREGEVPAVIYGPGKDSVLLSVSVKDLENILKKTNVGQAILNLEIQNGGESTRTAMIKELQIHPVSRKYLHVDFYEIAMDRKIKVKVPVVTQGIAKGVDFGGMLQVISREIEVLCLPLRIPKSIEIDITELNVGDAVHVRDIVLPEGVEISADVNYTVVTVLATKVEEKVSEEEVEEEAAAAAPVKEEAKAGGKE